MMLRLFRGSQAGDIDILNAFRDLIWLWFGFKGRSGEEVLTKFH